MLQPESQSLQLPMPLSPYWALMTIEGSRETKTGARYQERGAAMTNSHETSHLHQIWLLLSYHRDNLSSTHVTPTESSFETLVSEIKQERNKMENSFSVSDRRSLVTLEYLLNICPSSLLSSQCPRLTFRFVWLVTALPFTRLKHLFWNKNNFCKLQIIISV